jgi:hypothetical protein
MTWDREAKWSGNGVRLVRVWLEPGSGGPSSDVSELWSSPNTDKKIVSLFQKNCISDINQIS